MGEGWRTQKPTQTLPLSYTQAHSFSVFLNPHMNTHIYAHTHAETHADTHTQTRTLSLSLTLSLYHTHTRTHTHTTHKKAPGSVSSSSASNLNATRPGVEEFESEFEVSTTWLSQGVMVRSLSLNTTGALSARIVLCVLSMYGDVECQKFRF